MLLLLLSLAASAGAAWQRSLGQNDSRPTVLRLAVPDLQDRLSILTRHAGALDARLQVLQHQGSKLADAIGVKYFAPELVAMAREQNLVASARDLDLPAGEAEMLGREIDRLAAGLARLHDTYELLGLSLSWQKGTQASLPTQAPLPAITPGSAFGWRTSLPGAGKRMHEGVDFPALAGTPIHAASGGQVLRASWVRGYGKMVEIDHGNGLHTRYAHASSLLVKPGDFVRQGDTIALVGSSGHATGPHLHYELRFAGYPLDPGLLLHMPAVAQHDSKSLADRQAGMASMQAFAGPLR